MTCLPGKLLKKLISTPVTVLGLCDFIPIFVVLFLYSILSVNVRSKVIKGILFQRGYLMTIALNLAFGEILIKILKLKLVVAYCLR